MARKKKRPANETASPPSPPLCEPERLHTKTPPRRVAHCLVGVAWHQYGGHNYPLTDVRMYGAMRRWLDGLADLNVRSDVFMHIDVTNWPMSYPYYRKKKWIKVAVLGGAAWRETTASTPLSALNGTIAALRPVSMKIHSEEPYCARRNCSCSPSFPRWWEQVAKNNACFDSVQRYEAEHGFRYDFVTKIRTDYNFDLDGATPEVVASAMQAETIRQRHGRFPRRAGGKWFGLDMDGTGRLPQMRSQPPPAARPSADASVHAPVIQLSPWGNGLCYAASDWFVLAPRRAAAVYFNFSSDVSCAWQRCLARRYAVPGFGAALGCMFNERELIEWILWRGVRVAALPDQRVSRVDVCKTQAQGHIGLEHPWHVDRPRANGSAPPPSFSPPVGRRLGSQKLHGGRSAEGKSKKHGKHRNLAIDSCAHV